MPQRFEHDQLDSDMVQLRANGRHPSATMELDC